MASFIYNSFADDLAKGNIDLDTDTFYMTLHTSSYSPDKDAHTKFSNVTNEVSGTGYTAGGAACAVTLNKDTTNDKETMTFAATSWSSATITARYAVVRKRRGGAASADELIFINDFGADVSSSAATFSVGSSVLIIQN